MTSGASPLVPSHEYLGFVCDLGFGVREFSFGECVVNPNVKLDTFISVE